MVSKKKSRIKPGFFMIKDKTYSTIILRVCT